MRGTLLIFSPAGIRVERSIGEPSLELFAEFIRAGYLEAVPHWSSIEHGGARRRCVAFCDEDGKRLGLPVNRAATLQWDAAMKRDHGCGCAPDYLVGTVVVVFGDPEFMAAL